MTDKYIEKANQTLATVQPEGVLGPEIVETFVKKVVITSALLPMTNTFTMKREEWEQPRIGVAGQAMYPDRELTKSTVAQRAVVEADRRKLKAHPFKVVANISDRVLANVIEENNFIPYIIPLLAEKAGTEIEDVVINGDTTLPPNTNRNLILCEIDGIVKQANTNVYDANNEPLNGIVLDELELMTPPAHRQRPGMVVLTSSEAAIRYRQYKAARATAAGDAQTATAILQNHHGLDVVSIPLFPSIAYGAGTQTVAIRCIPKEIMVGFRTNMKMEMQRDADSGSNLVVMRYSFDVTFLHPEAVAKATEVKAR